MSHVASTWAWQQKLDNARHKLLLVKLADSANDDGFCWPSVRTLAEHTGISKSAISRATKALADAGLIRIVERLKQDGSRGSNYYFLLMPGVSHSGGTPASHSGRDTVSHAERDITVKNPQENRQDPSAARAAEPAPEHLGERRWRVASKRPNAGPFVVDLSTTKCTCENRSTTPCRHVRAAALAEERAEKVRLKALRDAVWDGLTEAFGQPAERQKSGFGAIRNAIFEHLVAEEVEQTPERWKVEVGRRYNALVLDWGVGKVTLHSFGQNWIVAGKLLKGGSTSHPSGHNMDDGLDAYN